MIPWDTFKTPQDAYDWAKANMNIKDYMGRLKFTILAPRWSDSWYVLDQHWRAFVELPRVRR